MWCDLLKSISPFVFQQVTFKLFSHLVCFAGPNLSVVIPPSPADFLLSKRIIWLRTMVCLCQRASFIYWHKVRKEKGKAAHYLFFIFLFICSFSLRKNLLIQIVCIIYGRDRWQCNTNLQLYLQNMHTCRLMCHSLKTVAKIACL